MGRHRKVRDLTTPIPTPSRQLDTPSGFCITGHHETCQYQFSHGLCGCECHKENK